MVTLPYCVCTFALLRWWLRITGGNFALLFWWICTTILGYQLRLWLFLLSVTFCFNVKCLICSPEEASRDLRADVREGWLLSQGFVRKVAIVGSWESWTSGQLRPRDWLVQSWWILAQVRRAEKKLNHSFLLSNWIGGPDPRCCLEFCLKNKQATPSKTCLFAHS